MGEGAQFCYAAAGGGLYAILSRLMLRCATERGEGLKNGKICVIQRVIDPSMKKPMAIPIPRVTNIQTASF